MSEFRVPIHPSTYSSVDNIIDIRCKHCNAPIGIEHKFCRFLCILDFVFIFVWQHLMIERANLGSLVLCILAIGLVIAIGLGSYSAILGLLITIMIFVLLTILCKWRIKMREQRASNF